MSTAGRPPLVEGRKSDRLMIRLTEDEHAAMNAAASAAGKPTSTWARDEQLRLAREINRPAVKRTATGKKPAKLQ